jgi:phage anti-repressor protein
LFVNIIKKQLHSCQLLSCAALNNLGRAVGVPESKIKLPQNYDISRQMFKILQKFSVMKKKSDGMSPDMFHDATSSTPIPAFTPINEGTKNESQNLLQNETDDNFRQNELIKIDFEKQTVSARALYDFLDLTERFSKWFKRMISYGLVEKVDFTAVSFVICHKQPENFTSVNNGTPPVPNGTGGIPLFTDVNNGVYQDIGDYLLTIDAAKHIAMVQRNEKGKQARNYFINIEKLYHFFCCTIVYFFCTYDKTGKRLAFWKKNL